MPFPAPAHADGVALVPLEPLGLDAERALRLEALFRAELERLAGRPLPARESMQRDVGLARCSGAPDCLASAGRRLGVAAIISGNIGELGDSYVVNLKLIDVARAVEVRRVSERLRGQPDELIDAVRVAAHRLLRPEEVRGSLAILSDVPATIFLDDREVGRAPLARPLDGLAVGPHRLRLEARGMPPYTTDVDVHFQKTSEVVVRLGDKGGAIAPRPSPRTWTSSPWVWVAAGAGAVVLGLVVGRALASDPVIDCAADPARCP